MRRFTAIVVSAAVALTTITAESTAGAAQSAPAGHAPPRAHSMLRADVPAPPTPPRARPVERTLGHLVSTRPTRPPRAGAGLAATAPAGPGGTLVLYDTTGPYGWLGEVYATNAANLASRFGSWTAHPVNEYVAGEMAGYAAVIYIGSTYDEPLPLAFLDDVLAATIPVTWMYDNIWQLTARDPGFASSYGFTWKGFDFSTVGQVRYRQTALTRDTRNGAGIMDYAIYDPGKVSVLGTAVRPDGTEFPWAVRSGRLTYVGEIPFSYVTHDDRYLAFADLMYDALAPGATPRHRALVRIEDVGPDADPKELRAVADYLHKKKVPFSVAVYPEYRDPLGVYSGGVPVTVRLADAPEVVSALQYMQSRGGTLLMHGYTHQYASRANPYSAVSADDFEFFLAHVDADDYVRYDGPVPEDSAEWAAARVEASATAFAEAGFARPSIFEFPHYAGSAIDYRLITSAVGTRYDRGLYFPGVLSGGPVDHARLFGQFFPYPVRDIYGAAVVPENLGNVELTEFNHNPPRLPADILASAQRNLVVRDGVASFFYHPFLGTSYLRTVVEGVQDLGYTFVPASAVLAG